MDARCVGFELDRDIEEALPAFAGRPAESDLQFYSRRAMEESRLAQRASCARAAAAHRYLAASYSSLVKREMEMAAELDELARLIP
jgi:hypothetical protein